MKEPFSWDRIHVRKGIYALDRGYVCGVNAILIIRVCDTVIALITVRLHYQPE
jgi:hypothetical protein